MAYCVGIALLLLLLVGVWGRRWRPVPDSYSVDAQGVRRAGKQPEQVRWQDLVRIEIMTTDEGPLADDVFWLFHGHDGSGCALPSSQVGDALFERLKRLSGVDYEAVLLAMGSTEWARFPVWSGERGAAALASEA